MTQFIDFISLFRSLTEKNRLCRSHGFDFLVVSDLEGFGEAIDSLQELRPLICASDCSSGSIDFDNAPSTRRVHTVFMFMPHPLDDAMLHRQRCFDIMREIVRQFMSVVIRQVSRFQLDGAFINRSVSFQEIDRYFFSGGACAFFQLAVDYSTDLILRPDEWTSQPIPDRMPTHAVSSPTHSTIR